MSVIVTKVSHQCPLKGVCIDELLAEDNYFRTNIDLDDLRGETFANPSDQALAAGLRFGAIYSD
jgi:hypothetical protein